jgi:hypothetical protein
MNTQNIPDILKSKRFWVAFGYTAVSLLVGYVPALADVQDDLIAAIPLIYGLVIGSYTLTDMTALIVTGRKLAAKTATPVDDIAVEGAATFFGVPAAGTEPG